MYDPCERCPCILRQEICKQFCTAYKAAVREEARKGLIDYNQQVHYRIVRAQK